MPWRSPEINARQQRRLSFIILCNLCKFTWPLRPLSKEGMSKPSFFPQPLGTIFLTGPDGFAYEVPEEVAKEYRIKPAAWAESAAVSHWGPQSGATAEGRRPRS